MNAISEELTTPEQALSLAQLILQQKPSPKGVVVLQLEHPELKWGKLRKAHLLLHASRKTLPEDLLLAHLNFKTPFSLERAPIATEVRFYDTLGRELNMEGLLCFSHWLDEDVAQILQSLPITATEEYQLEASLKNFRIELASYYLNTYTKDLHAALDKLCASDELEHEVQLLKLRREFNALLSFQYNALRDLEENTAAIIDQHPELKTLYEKAFLFRRLLGDQVEMPERAQMEWEQRVLYLHLLVEMMGLFLVVLGQSNNLSFRAVTAFRAALAELQKKYGFAALFALTKVKDPLWVDLKALFLKYLNEGGPFPFSFEQAFTPFS